MFSLGKYKVATLGQSEKPTSDQIVRAVLRGKSNLLQYSTSKPNIQNE